MFSISFALSACDFIKLFIIFAASKFSIAWSGSTATSLSPAGVFIERVLVARSINIGNSVTAPTLSLCIINPSAPFVAIFIPLMLNLSSILNRVSSSSSSSISATRSSASACRRAWTTPISTGSSTRPTSENAIAGQTIRPPTNACSENAAPLMRPGTSSHPTVNGIGPGLWRASCSTRSRA